MNDGAADGAGFGARGVWRMAEGAAAPQVRPLVRLDGRRVALRHAGGGSFAGEGLWLQTTVRAEGPGFVLDLVLRLDAPRHVDFVGLECGPLRLTGAHQYFGAVAGIFDKRAVVPALEARRTGRSPSLVALLAGPEGSLLAGVDGPCDDPSAFVLAGDRFRAGFAPGRMLQGGPRFPLYLQRGGDPLELLAAFGRRQARRARPLGATPCGWNSWDFYGGAVRMEDLVREMQALERLRCRRRLGYLVLDLGWEEAWGAWSPNRKFPAAAGAVARRIRAAGWKPGIWMAPFQVGLYTPLARHRQDLFLRNAEGGLIVEEGPCGPVLLLDFTLPEARALLAGWAGGLRKSGFELFKIDFVYEQYLRQARHSAGSAGKVAFVRLLFQTLRDAIGEDAHLLNCGGSQEAVLGIADSARVSMDIHTFWGHIRNSARQLAQAFWMNRRLWFNDPDFVLARHHGNCTAPALNPPYTPRPLEDPNVFWMRGPEASRNEMRLWLSVVRLNGGSLFLSDSIDALTAEGRSDLDRLFPPLEAGFVPLDLFERTWPGVWLSEDRKRPTLGLFNWEDAEQTLALPSGRGFPARARDFWSGRTVRLGDAVRLAPRSGRLLEL